MDIKTIYQFWDPIFLKKKKKKIWDPIPRFRCQSIEISHKYVTTGCKGHKYILDSSLF